MTSSSTQLASAISLELTRMTTMPTSLLLGVSFKKLSHSSTKRWASLDWAWMIKRWLLEGFMKSLIKHRLWENQPNLNSSIGRESTTIQILMLSWLTFLLKSPSLRNQKFHNDLHDFIIYTSIINYSRRKSNLINDLNKYITLHQITQLSLDLPNPLARNQFIILSLLFADPFFDDSSSDIKLLRNGK